MMSVIEAVRQAELRRKPRNFSISIEQLQARKPPFAWTLSYKVMSTAPGNNPKAEYRLIGALASVDRGSTSDCPLFSSRRLRYFLRASNAASCSGVASV